MADQCTSGTLESHSIFIENSVKDKLKLVECAVAMSTLAEKDCKILKLLGDKEFSSCEELSLVSKKLSQLPSEFGVYMKNLTYLDLSDNELSTLPLSLKFVIHLENLILDKNCLRTLPFTIVELSFLKVLQLSKNRIETLPTNFGDIESLETLNLSSNKLYNLPDSFKKLNRLKTLNLSDNCFTNMPLCLEKLRSLETLNLSFNKLTKLPDSYGRLNDLKNIDLSINSFKTFPVCIAKGMQGLEIIDISHNNHINITTAPATEKLKRFYAKQIGLREKFPLWLFSGCAPRLELLNFEGTKFKPFTIPDNCPRLGIKSLLLQNCNFYDAFIDELTSHTDKLECLKIGNFGWVSGNNAFWSIPINNLEHPELLTEIELRATGLPVVCRTIKNFVNLVKLDIGKNAINWLCSEICSLDKLEILLIDENHLCELPENIGKMTALKELKANSNRLANLPESMSNMKKLAYLDLYDNEFRDMPRELQNMENLVGLDLDVNSVAIHDNDCIKDTPYGTLREAIRSRYGNPCITRNIGRRYERDAGEESDANCSDISAQSCHEWKTQNEDNCLTPEELAEDWDNSADEFDPTRESKAGLTDQWTIDQYMALGAKGFCPADLHAEPVRYEIARMRARGEIIDDVIVEGQFDDA